MSLRGLCPLSLWDAWENLRKLPRWRCFWRRMTRASSRVSNCLWTAGGLRSDRKRGRFFWRDRSEGPSDEIDAQRREAMNRKNSREKELSKHREKPSTYRRVATKNVNGKAVVQNDESLLAYEFKTV